MCLGTGAQEPESTMTIWRVFGTMKDEEWHYAQANISSGSHRLIFEVTGDNYRVGIKNVSVVPGLCPDFSKYWITNRLPVFLSV